MCFRNIFHYHPLYPSIDKRSIKIGTLSNVGTFPFAYSSVSRTYIISNVNIEFAMVTMVVGPIQIYPNDDIKVFNKHQVSDHLYTLPLSMVPGEL